MATTTRKRRGRQLYMLKEIWDKVEIEAKEDDISINEWLEIKLKAYFVKKESVESEASS